METLYKEEEIVDIHHAGTAMRFLTAFKTKVVKWFDWFT
jgi:5-enolpyruvylshikimate-3-phosphate synthase